MKTTSQLRRLQGWRALFLASGTLLLSALMAFAVSAQEADRVIRFVRNPEAAPEFKLDSIDGKPLTLASAHGKVVLLNFWATWCGPCRAEIPALVELQKQYAGEGKDVVILGISVDDPVDKLKPYAAQMKMNYPVLVGKDHEDVQDAFGPLWGIPVTVFVGRDGNIALKHSGIATKEQFEQEIKSLL